MRTIASPILIPTRASARAPVRDRRRSEMSKQFAFRRRASRGVFAELYADDEDANDDENFPDGIVPPSAIAAAHAGYDHVRMSFAEAEHFGDDVKGAVKEGTYLGIRNAILERWMATGCREALSVEATTHAIGVEDVAFGARVFRYLERVGGINYGACARVREGGDEATATEETVAVAEEAEARDVPTTLDVKRALFVVLKEADLTVDTEKVIRTRLEERIGVSMKAFKAVIRETIDKYLADPAATQAEAEASGEDETTTHIVEIPPPKAFVDVRPTIVIGAGPAGLAAANLIRAQGGEVVVLEARSRVGGRVHTDRETFSAPVDLGASIVTGVSEDPKRRTGLPWLGVRADPSGVVAKQLGLRLVELRDGCPLYDTKTGEKVSKDMDEKVERIRDLVMDEARSKVDANGESATAESSLGEALKEATESYFLRLVQDDGNDSDDSETHAAVREATAARTGLTERRLLDWHWANLEYGCSAGLNDISLPFWNQDEQYGGFGGAHCMVGEGYSTIMTRLAEDIDIRMDTPVTEIHHDDDGVRVRTKDGQEIEGCTVVVTIPLGCLKAGDVAFNPPLGASKSNAVRRLGFGNLNKVVLEFDEVFWDDSVDYFGSAIDSTENRGRGFMFWNLKNVSGKPMLISLIAGEAAKSAETEGSESIVKSACATLASICFPNDPSKMPPLKQSIVTRWQSDPYARGSYSYVAVGSKGSRDYDELGKPEGRVLFAGEHTCKEHPDTVGGAMLTGWRAARQALAIAQGEDVRTEIFDLEEMRAAIAKRNVDDDYEVDEDEELVDHMIDRAEMSHRRMQEDLLADAGKEEAKRIYRITSAAEFGENLDVPAALAATMDRLRTVPGRRALINALLEDVSSSDRRAWALKHGGFKLLNEWLIEINSHIKSTEALLLTTKMLELLLLAPADLPALRSSGIPRTLQNRFQTHESGRLRFLARQCGHKWMRALSRKSAGLPPLDEDDEDMKKTMKMPQRKKPSGLGAAVLLGIGKAKDVEDDVEEAVDLVVDDVEIDLGKTEEQKRAERDAVIAKAQDLPEGQAAIAARIAADRARETVEAAMRAAEEAQRIAREAELSATAGIRISKKDVISSFDDFSNAAGKKRERAKEKSKKRKATAAEDAAEDDEDDDAPSVSLDEYQARIRKQVRAYVHQQLAEKREREIVTKAECKKIEEKLVEKILENSSGINDTDKAFMTSKRKEKIKSLVSAYCSSTIKARGNKKSKHAVN